MESGYNKEVMTQNKLQQINTAIQCNYISNILNDRGLKLINTEKRKGTWTQNTMLMDKAQKYVQGMENKNKIINAINHIRLYKKIYLVYEFLELKG